MLVKSIPILRLTYVYFQYVTRLYLVQTTYYVFGVILMN